jgi:hypothetical protein
MVQPVRVRVMGKVNMPDGKLHIRSHNAKLSDKFADWGFKTLCGQTVERELAATTPKSGESNCKECVRSLVIKKESEIQKLRNILLEEE